MFSQQRAVIDMHCDALFRMHTRQWHDFENHPNLDVTYSGLQKANYAMQAFAIYLPQSVRVPAFSHVETYAELYRQHITSHPGIVPIRWREDLNNIIPGKKIGAMLTMEGAQGLQADIANVESAFNLGVRCLGLTWNYANWAADGVLEPRQAGLTLKGKELVKECNRLGIIVDISHLNETGFWEVIEHSCKPLIASHSNVYEVCPHPRNLKKEQFEAIFKKKGLVGVTYVPQFTKKTKEEVKRSDLLRHIEEICAWGGAKHIGLGSDFDGISKYIDGLSHVKDVIALTDDIYRLYSATVAEDILWRNWYHFFEKNLPAKFH